MTSCTTTTWAFYGWTPDNPKRQSPASAKPSGWITATPRRGATSATRTANSTTTKQPRQNSTWRLNWRFPSVPPPDRHLNPPTVPAQPARIVIGTSVWLPALTIPRPSNHRIMRLARKPAVTLVGNRETDEELRRKLREYYAPQYGIDAHLPIGQAYSLYNQYRITITNFPVHPTPRCEDPDDQMFIDIAYTSGAELLLTHYSKLIVMNAQTPFHIVHDHVLEMNWTRTKTPVALLETSCPSAAKATLASAMARHIVHPMATA